VSVRTLVCDPPPPEFAALLERRRRLGIDRRDEVWAGVLHVNPLPHGRHARVQAQLIALLAPLAHAGGLTVLAGANLGADGDFRGPDGMLQRPGPDRLYYPSAALVVEVLSPHDESWDKLAFYSSHGVEEIVIVDPQARLVHWLGLEGEEYRPLERSRLVDLGPRELGERIDWLAPED
jgi:Uma2 family endonuclease